MQIEAATYENGCLCLRTSDPLARRFAYDFKPGEYRIDKAKRKRSLDANAYCWTLIDKLSAAVGLPKDEVYRRAVKQIGGNSETVCVANDAVESLCKHWECNGLGWQTETFKSKIKGCTNVILYYGSSEYDTKQMSLLIDSIVQDCQQLGIETKTPNEIANLLSMWGGK